MNRVNYQPRIRAYQARAPLNNHVGWVKAIMTEIAEDLRGLHAEKPRPSWDEAVAKLLDKEYTGASGTFKLSDSYAPGRRTHGDGLSWIENTLCDHIGMHWDDEWGEEEEEEKEHLTGFLAECLRGLHAKKPRPSQDEAFALLMRKRLWRSRVRNGKEEYQSFTLDVSVPYRAREEERISDGRVRADLACAGRILAATGVRACCYRTP